ncbi:phosphonate C-P lyase system protein PhnG [Rhizobium oryzicola]|uniref:Phosphonate C-P lyase system protein PhnG n=1 Tax=Rhizobium oryzicola TaxID=1232668 RepID=A0ABT8T0B9_9HYPH|nr:phosphonate C-P lyase system protein PhnG [Rhizobium oryzicola]MDO1584162.1 phosphonate C-P lyase system protein PhnG [Rhizobium oryzicola]
MEAATTHHQAEPPARKRVLDLLARATRTDMETVFNALVTKPNHERLRGPETGLVMVRGRMGGGGAAFNLGEATVTRATIRFTDGTVGHSYRLGTDKRAAELAAIFDALWQQDSTHQLVEDKLLKPVEEKLSAEQTKRAAQTAATKVEFFTMVRGED